MENALINASADKPIAIFVYVIAMFSCVEYAAGAAVSVWKIFTTNV
ncbi:MAG: hypothetical protein AB1490_05350 [Pseudomonadota bacterium]